jgi:Leucine-rich repeat (LRR) protein
MVSEHKRKRRNVLVFRNNDDNFEIDEDDYRTMDRIVQQLRNVMEKEGFKKFDTTMDAVKAMVEINKNDDEERRVFKFRLLPWINSIPPRSITELDALEVLDLRGSNTEKLPSWLKTLRNLKELILASTKNLKKLPTYIGQLENIHTLILAGSNIKSLPYSIGQMKNLTILNLSCTNHLKILPNEICFLTKLEVLNLSSSNIISLPDYIDRLQNLKDLNLNYTKKLESLPDVGGLQKLETLNLRGSGISSLPSSLGKLLNLKDLNLDNILHLESLPDIEIGELTALQRLSVSDSKISSLSNFVGKLVNLKDLELRKVDFQLQNGLSDAVGSLVNLQELNLCESSNISLANFSMLKNLHVLDLSSAEGLRSPLHELGDLIQLKELDLRYTSISSLPTSIGKLKNLTRLNLARMLQLDCLPDEIHGLHKLEFLDISYSSISLLPDSSTKLKNLRVLDLYGTSIVDSTVPNRILWDLVRECPLLGCFGVIHDEDKPEYIKLEYDLSFNRAKSRVVLRDGTTILPTSLWPSILSKAGVAFNKYKLCDYFCDCGREEYDGPLTQSDAIFCLLVERGAKDLFFQQS